MSKLTTKQLAAKFKVKTSSVHQAKWLKGHFRGWEPCGYVEDSHEFVWRFVGEY